MSIKSKWINFKGGMDYMFSGLRARGIKGVIEPIWWGAVFGTGITLVSGMFGEEHRDDFSDNFDLQTYDEGALIKLPEDCDVGGHAYLISKKPKGGMELSKGSAAASSVMPIDKQEEVTEDITKCMVVLAEWAMDGNFKFADEFKIATNVTYSEAGNIYDIHDQTNWLRKDIIENGDDVQTLKEFVEAHDDYEEDGDNTALYAAEFGKAASAWVSYVKNKNGNDPYFDSNENIKNVDQYAKYEYDSMTLNKWFGTMGSMGAAMILFGGLSPITRRSTAYGERKAARDEKLTAIKLMEGRDGPIL
jgi:hypothetical protein